jgi:hypothetical protein
MTGNFAPAAPKCLARQPKQFAPDLRRYADLVDGLEGRRLRTRLTPVLREVTVWLARNSSNDGQLTPAGASPRVRCPHSHSRSMSWCSVTSTFTGGRSNTCRFSTPVTGRPANDRRQPAQHCGSCGTCRSALSTC